MKMKMYMLSFLLILSCNAFLFADEYEKKALEEAAASVIADGKRDIPVDSKSIKSCFLHEMDPEECVIGKTEDIVARVHISYKYNPGHSSMQEKVSEAWMNEFEKEKERDIGFIEKERIKVYEEWKTYEAKKMDSVCKCAGSQGVTIEQCKREIPRRIKQLKRKIKLKKSLSKSLLAFYKAQSKSALKNIYIDKKASKKLQKAFLKYKEKQEKIDKQHSSCVFRYVFPPIN